jgi:serine protease Do
MQQSAPLSPFRPAKRRVGARTALLGAVASLALIGAGVNVYALAPDAPTQIQAQPAAGPGSFADIVDRVKPAVVSVKVKTVEKVTDDDEDEGNRKPRFRDGDPLERFFRRFGEEGVPFGRGVKPRQGMSQGSGFVISADGYVVTNNHVVANASEVMVTLDDGRTLPAKVVGVDKKTDLALLKLTEGGNFKYVTWAPGSPRIGDWVIAVGNPFGLGGTVTAGIVSARGRDIGAGPYDDFLQIDAPVNRGNSGGPTFDARGQVVGVNTAIFSPSGGSVGIGFAIPAEVAQSVVASLKDNGSVTRGWIGVQIQPVTPEIADSLGLKAAKGALVAEPQANSPAVAAGLKSGDVITAVNGERIDGPRELARKIAAAGPDKSVELTYWRDGAEKTAQVKLGKLPEREARAERPAKAEKSSLAGLGVELAPAASLPGAGKDGVVVADIDPEGLAARKGLKTGDVILEAAGKPVARPSDITDALATARKEGHKAVLLRVKSADGVRFLALAANPAG